MHMCNICSRSDGTGSSLLPASLSTSQIAKRLLQREPLATSDMYAKWWHAKCACLLKLQGEGGGEVCGILS